MNSTELKQAVLSNIKTNHFIKDAWFVNNHGPAHFFKFKTLDNNEYILYFSLLEEFSSELLEERINRKLKI